MTDARLTHFDSDETGATEGATTGFSDHNPRGVIDETGDASASAPDDRRDRRDHRATDPADDEPLGAGDTNRVRHTSGPGDVEDDTATNERDTTAESGPTGQDKLAYLNLRYQTSP